MAAYTYINLIEQCLKRIVRKPIQGVASHTDDSRFLANAITLANSRINGLLPWDWLRAEGEVVLLATSSGTVNVSNGSANYSSWSGSTGSGYVGGLMHIVGTGSVGNDAMRILTSGASGTFTSNWQGAADTNATATLAQDTYALPTDFDKPLSTGSFVSSPFQMTALDPERFFKTRQYEATRLSSPFSPGQPEVFTIWGQGDGSQKLLVYPFPLDATTLSIRYFRKPTSLSADGDVPDMPREFQEILIYRALDLWYRDKELDMTKRAMFHQMFLEVLGRMRQSVTRTGDRSGMQPADAYRSHYSA